MNGVGFGSTEINVLRVKPGYLNEYMLYRLQEDNFMAIAISSMTGAGGLKRVPSELLSSYIVAIPSLQEQKNIADFILEKNIKIDDLIAKSESAIDLLKERRTALISAAVTGKIDVRDWSSSA